MFHFLGVLRLIQDSVDRVGPQVSCLLRLVRRTRIALPCTSQRCDRRAHLVSAYGTAHSVACLLAVGLALTSCPVAMVLVRENVPDVDLGRCSAAIAFVPK